jgi:hypothetical protein
MESLYVAGITDADYTLTSIAQSENPNKWVCISSDK